ncbi:hypothetical protein [Polymorphospora lycopeni]|uniref:Secreted protein n=1 Tax=Polymorphospora lycopeni TaxID=3140240 RepID=A0ABV5CP56_9ACTN
MHRKRIATLAAAPLALLIGSAVLSASTANASHSTAPAVASSTCNAPDAEKILTVEEGIALVKKCSARADAAAPGWHWMGNYGSVYDVVAVANGGGIGPGELIAQPQSSGLVPSFMYY